MHGVMQQPLMRALKARHVAQQPDAAKEPRILARHRMRFQVVPEIGAIVTAQTKIKHKVATLLLL
jgi:hypothetical protein